MSTPPKPVTASCHCGAITVTVPYKPTRINECQCTLCRRYAAAWAYYTTADVQISPAPSHEESAASGAYIWGDKHHGFHFCRKCGCVMCWYPCDVVEGKVDAKEGKQVGVNTRMMRPEDVREVDREVLFDALKMTLGKDVPKEERHVDDGAVYED
ncbi:uncharacterized protein AB675_7321 [Cyphellophora attinorum]|uniref:CENP-V/GFA domain-containing protein n=1 Tax=Cyphellophora attinorum TaxID=1664694 RepID=A0A0N0NIZ3_9EURO|nr:uncharacterized protein AB675_7321 [Phialophora attinorum]KPI36318.1 hypothetical protein AB675_7321 [Phialophora attinorum]